MSSRRPLGAAGTPGNTMEQGGPPRTGAPMLSRTVLDCPFTVPSSRSAKIRHRRRPAAFRDPTGAQGPAPEPGSCRNVMDLSFRCCGNSREQDGLPRHTFAREPDAVLHCARLCVCCHIGRVTKHGTDAVQGRRSTAPPAKKSMKSGLTLWHGLCSVKKA